MCSGLRLLKIATSKTQPSTRPRTSAWLETSMATAVTPRSRITANSAWRSVASGVVRSDLRRSSPIRVSTVPMRPVSPPTGRPPPPLSDCASRRPPSSLSFAAAARRPPSMRYAVVVFPEVPVMPIWRRSSPGAS